MNEAARVIIEALGLSPHPEGGFFRETFRAPLAVEAPQGPRSASTAIYYLLAAGTFSALHRVRSDEVWHHYDGDPLELHLISEAGVYEVTTLGRNIVRGERPQLVVPAGVWQAALPLGTRFALCGCTVAPGFDFADFEMPSRQDLANRLPALKSAIDRFTRD